MSEVKDGWVYPDDFLPGDVIQGVNEWIDGGPKSRLVEMRLIRDGKIIAIARPKQSNAD